MGVCRFLDVFGVVCLLHVFFMFLSWCFLVCACVFSLVVIMLFKCRLLLWPYLQ